MVDKLFFDDVERQAKKAKKGKKDTKGSVVKVKSKGGY